MLKIFILLMCTFAIGKPSCNQSSVMKSLSIPTYEFSVRLLDKVSQESEGHFVFSPISTWLQLMALADGAQGLTLGEIIIATKLNMVCSRNLVRQIFNSLNAELSGTIRRQSIYVIDKLLDVKKSFVTNVESLNGSKVLQARFGNVTEFEAKENTVIDSDTKDLVNDILYDSDYSKTVLLLADVANTKADWESPFNRGYTKREKFYSYDNVQIGYVNMMNQIGSFNFNNIPTINAQALELPFNKRLSMIFLLPNSGTARDLYLTMKNVRMATIIRSLRSNGPKLVNVKIPRFNLTTDIDNLPELLYDMDVYRLFSPRWAELKKISDYTVYVSMMATKFGIEVTETGVTASVAPETIAKRNDSIDVTFNKPFGFLLVDKRTNVILYAGVYSKPSLY